MPLWLCYVLMGIICAVTALAAVAFCFIAYKFATEFNLDHLRMFSSDRATSLDASDRLMEKLRKRRERENA